MKKEKTKISIQTLLLCLCLRSANEVVSSIIVNNWDRRFGKIEFRFESGDLLKDLFCNFIIIFIIVSITKRKDYKRKKKFSKSYCCVLIVEHKNIILYAFAGVLLLKKNYRGTAPFAFPCIKSQSSARSQGGR